MAIVSIIYLAIIVLMVASMWKVFDKAGQPGWACLIPIYNIIVMLKIAGKPTWWLLMFFIPVANIIFAIMMYVAIAKSFGKGTGFALGMIFLAFIFWPMLGFGDAEYLGPEGDDSPAIA